MRSLILFICVSLTAVFAAVPQRSQRIVGGYVTSIASRPNAAALLYAGNGVNFYQECGGSILTSTAILTAAHCVYGDPLNRWRVRVGSANANSGGVVHNLRIISINPYYNSYTFDSDIAVVRTQTTIVLNNNARALPIAGANYNLLDNQMVYAIGWGATTFNGPFSEQLREVQIWTINQATCRTRYAELSRVVTDNMLCTGWLDVGGRDTCQGDAGGPIIHNNVVVGVASWGQQCGLARYPGVGTRVSRFTGWIQSVS